MQEIMKNYGGGDDKYQKLKSHDEEGKYEIMMKKFVYIFIIDLGISPFVQCYNGRNLFQACIHSQRLDFFEELLSHKYELLNNRDLDTFRNSIKKYVDYKG